MSTAANITLTAGGITFANQWYNTKTLDWRVPVATLVLSAAIELLNDADSTAAVLLSLIILSGALTTQFGGKNPLQTIGGIAGKKP